MKKILKLSLVIITLFMLMAGGVLFFLSQGLEEGDQLVINDVNLTLLDDGVYQGKYDSGRWSNQIEVAVNNHQISKITIVKDVMFARPEVTDELFKNVIDSQSLIVDVISGATVTSKVYLKSIEQALQN